MVNGLWAKKHAKHTPFRICSFWSVDSLGCLMFSIVFHPCFKEDNCIPVVTNCCCHGRWCGSPVLANGANQARKNNFHETETGDITSRLPSKGWLCRSPCSLVICQLSRCSWEAHSKAMFIWLDHVCDVCIAHPLFFPFVGWWWWMYFPFRSVSNCRQSRQKSPAWRSRAWSPCCSRP